MHKYKIGIILLMSCFLPFTLHAGQTHQVVAAQDNPEMSITGEQISLQESINKIEEKFNVNILFRTQQVRNRSVAKRNKLSDNLVSALKQLLRPLGMTFERINAKNYIIFDKETPVLPKVVQETVLGIVTDAQTGETLPGVNILVKGTTIGTSTNQDGKFKLQVPSLQDTLMISFVGYETREIPINSRKKIAIPLEPQAITGDELVVVGYGTQRKINLTGSVATVGSDEFENIASPNTSTLLQGKISGVTVSNFTPQPGKDNAEIRIRGVGTFNAGRNPLVVIDGVASSVSQFGQIPPADIKNVTVLKDAASAAIYGARAANGVLLVETKQGSESKPEVTFRSTFTRQTPLVELDLLESWEYAGIVNEWETEQGGQAIYTDEMIQKMKTGSDPDRFANTDWFSEIVQPATMQDYYLSVAGGTESTQYMISANYKDQPGLMINTASKQYSIRSNITIDVSDKTQIGMNLFGSRETIDEPAAISASETSGTGSLVNYLRRHAAPTIPVKYSNGNWGTVDGAYPAFGVADVNPVHSANLGNRYTNEYHLSGRLYGNIELLNRLEIKSQAAIIYNSSIGSTFNPTYEVYDAKQNVVAANATNSLSNFNTTDYKVSNSNTITFNEQFGKHNFTLLGGQSIEYYRSDHQYAYAEGFPNNNIHELTAGVENLSVDGWAQDYGLFSLFGRASYNYDSRYLLEANVRYDGSSRLPEGSRFEIFPSFSAGWVISREPFIEGGDLLSFLKLRGSWGKLGNQEIGNYPYVQTLATGQDYLIGGELQGGVAVTSLANSDISWETTTITDIGIDAYFFSDQLQLTVDYFDKTTSDILLRLPVPPNQGNVSAPFRNVGEVKNRGWEVSVDYTHVFGNGLNINGGINFSHVDNEITDLGEMGDNELGGWIDGNSVNVERRPIGAYYGYVAEGFFQSEQEIQNHAEQFGDLAPGDIKFRDLNNDGVIDPNNDRKIIGNPFPEYSFGINFGAQFQGFDFTAFLQGLAGIDRWNYYNNEYLSGRNFTESIKDHWSENNRDAEFPRLANQVNNNSYSTYYLADASYLRLKHLEVGYTLPVELIRPLSISNARIYFAGYNLLTFTKMRDFDPETATGDSRHSGYPKMKNYAVGISLKF